MRIKLKARSVSQRSMAKQRAEKEAKVLNKIFAIKLDYLDLGCCQSLQLICIRYDDNPGRAASSMKISVEKLSVSLLHSEAPVSFRNSRSAFLSFCF